MIRAEILNNYVLIFWNDCVILTAKGTRRDIPRLLEVAQEQLNMRDKAA
jgi:hypothetical protein